MSELFPEDSARVRREAAKRERARAMAEKKLRKREADFTGREIVRRELGAGWLVYLGTDPLGRHRWRIGGVVVELDRALHALDLGAGAGVWSSELRRKAAREGWPVHITAVELEPDELRWLERHADEVIIGDWREAFGMVLDLEAEAAEGHEGIWVYPGDARIAFDLVLGNPPFSQARAATRRRWPINPEKGSVPEPMRKAALARNAPVRKALVAEQLRELARAGRDPRDRDVIVLGKALAEYDPRGSMVGVALQHAPACFLYLSQQGWTKTASGWLTRMHYPIARIYDVPGSISHREGGGGDSISYAGSLWLVGHDGPAETYMLEPFADRAWRVRPGTEPDAWCDAEGIPLLVRGVA